MQEEIQFALLIDAENISAKYISVIFDELEKYGYASCRRIYGNWSQKNQWDENTLLEYSINPIQQFSYTKGKNSTDMAMVIDAMDLLYQNKVDGFCIVTSDSDFTRLAMRLREEKKYVLGMGESKTPIALTRACNKFIHLNLIDETEKDDESVSSNTGEDVNALENVTGINHIEKAILAMLEQSGEKRLELGLVGSRLGQKFPDFDVRNYGYSKLSVLLCEEMPHFRIEKEENRNYVKKQVQAREDIVKEVEKIIKQNGDQIDNLSMILSELKRRYAGFDLKDYGYNRISSFLRSMKNLEVNKNTVKVKGDQKKQKSKKKL